MKNPKILKKVVHQTSQKVQTSNLLFIGLGNPGEKYSGTRHNAGFAVIDYIAEKNNIKLKKTFLKKYIYGQIETSSGIIGIAKPMTYMNLSGTIIRDVIKRTGVCNKDLFIICDNMDLPPGAVRLKTRGSATGHKGIRSIMEYLETGSFNRLYIGVGRPEDNISVTEHVLGKFEPEDEKLFLKSVEAAGDALMEIMSKSLVKVMNEINR